MADYQLTATTTVIRTADQVSIPDNPANRDRQQYDAWQRAAAYLIPMSNPNRCRRCRPASKPFYSIMKIASAHKKARRR